MSKSLAKPVNFILKALPESEYQNLKPHLKTVELNLGQVLHEPGKTITTVYFPTQGMVSLLSTMLDSSTTEIGLIGSEGMVGLPVIWGGEYDLRQSIVQISGFALALPANILRQEFNRGQTLQKLLLLYTQALFTQVSQTAACNRQHKIAERFAHWLLLVHDCVKEDEFLLTHSLIAHMLGTRRSGVTIAAGILRKEKIISYHHGSIKILDLERLEQVSCECYGLVHGEFLRLLGSHQRN